MTWLETVLFIALFTCVMAAALLLVELFRRQEATGRAVRTLAEAFNGLPAASPVFLEPAVPGVEDRPWSEHDEPATKTPTTVGEWVIGERRKVE